MDLFTASIETEEFKSHQHPFHLGTDENIARNFIVQLFGNRIASGQPTISIALISSSPTGRRIVDVFDGTWMNREFTSNAEVRRARRSRVPLSRVSNSTFK